MHAWIGIPFWEGKGGRCIALLFLLFFDICLFVGPFYAHERCVLRSEAGEKERKERKMNFGTLLGLNRCLIFFSSSFIPSFVVFVCVVWR